MDARHLKSIQRPIKERFRAQPDEARITLKATGRIDDDDIVCEVDTARAEVKAGLHPASGGSKHTVCSGDMLLEALAACAGVTLKAVAVSLDIEIKSGTVRAEGDLDFRGALGIDSEVAVGFSDVRLRFDLDTDASPAERDRLIEMTERYCVVYQTLRQSPRLGLETHLVVPGEAPMPVGIEGVEGRRGRHRSPPLRAPARRLARLVSGGSGANFSRAIRPTQLPQAGIKQGEVVSQGWWKIGEQA